jgi:hypothetical protein
MLTNSKSKKKQRGTGEETGVPLSRYPEGNNTKFQLTKQEEKPGRKKEKTIESEKAKEVIQVS